MEYYRVIWDNNKGYVHVTNFSNRNTAFRFMDYVDSLGWYAGSFETIKV